MKVNPLIVFRREFDGSAILFNPDNGDTFGLNPTAAFFWEQLELGTPESQLLPLLSEKTELPPEAESDLGAFLAELRSKGYLAE